MAGEMVTVACKLPHGLQATIMKRNPDGGFLPTVEASAFFRGSARARRLERADDKGVPIELDPLTTVHEGFGLTRIAADFWTEWLAQNKDYPAVREGLIFASKPGANAEASARAQAVDHTEKKSGFEPLDPRKPGKGLEPTNEGLKDRSVGSADDSSPFRD
jgi:hypothetical protein